MGVAGATIHMLHEYRFSPDHYFFLCYSQCQTKRRGHARQFLFWHDNDKDLKRHIFAAHDSDVLYVFRCLQIVLI